MLSRKTKYGLKALTYLERQEDTTPVQISVIANYLVILPKSHGFHLNFWKVSY